MNARIMYHRTPLNHLSVWIHRFRKRKGYGVHSPSAYYLIRGVFFEKTPYYDYSRLRPVVDVAHEFYPQWVEHRRFYELIFRLVNEVQPSCIFEVGTGIGLTTLYLAAPCKHIPVTSVDMLRTDEQTDFVKALMRQHAPLVNLHQTDRISTYVVEEFEVIGQRPLFFIRLDLLSPEEAEQILVHILEIVTPLAVLIVTGIHSMKRLNELWKRLINSDCTGVTFDLYELGVVFFNPTYSKQNYLINF